MTNYFWFHYPCQGQVSGFFASETLLDLVQSFINFLDLDNEIHFLLDGLSQKEGKGGPHNGWINTYHLSNKVSSKVGPLSLVPGSDYVLESDSHSPYI
jgi:hypothetical protein